MPMSEEQIAELEAAVASGENEAGGSLPGPPPLRGFGLVLHHDGAWRHEGILFRNRRLVQKFDRSVRYLPEEGGVYVVQIGRFRGVIEVEEAGFFVRELDLERGTVRLSDQSEELLDVSGLSTSDRDGAAQADFMNAIDESGENVAIKGRSFPLPDLSGA